MKCGHGNSEEKCIYPKCQNDCGKERPDCKGATILRGMTPVYSVVAYGDYGAGYAVVAAASPKDAFRVADASLDPGTWRIKWLRGKADLMDGLQYNGTEQLLDHFEYGE